MMPSVASMAIDTRFNVACTCVHLTQTWKDYCSAWKYSNCNQIKAPYIGLSSTFFIIFLLQILVECARN